MASMFVQVNGVRLGVEQRGEARNSGPALFILQSASPALDDPGKLEQRSISDEALAASIERDGVQAFIERWEKLPLFASQKTLPLESRETLRRQRLQNRATGLAQSLRGVGLG